MKKLYHLKCSNCGSEIYSRDDKVYCKCKGGGYMDVVDVWISGDDVKVVESEEGKKLIEDSQYAQEHLEQLEAEVSGIRQNLESAKKKYSNYKEENQRLKGEKTTLEEKKDALKKELRERTPWREEDGMFICNKCGKEFDNKKSITSHMSAH